jgi:putative transposase
MGLRATLAEAHRRYTGAINARFQWTGQLFQGRFGAVVAHPRGIEYSISLLFLVGSHHCLR